MTAQSIPIPQGVPFFVETVPLEGVNYVLGFFYNQRQGTYRMTIGLPNGDGDPIPLAAVKLVSNFPLLRRRTDTRLPPGEFICTCSPTGSTAPPGLNDFGPGLRVEMTYYPSTDLDSSAASGNVVTQVACSDVTAGHVYRASFGGAAVAYVVPSGATGITIAANFAALISSLPGVLAAAPYPDPNDPTMGTSTIGINTSAGNVAVSITTS